MEARDSVYDEKGLTLFELWSDSFFSNIYTMYTTSERGEPEKKLK